MEFHGTSQLVIVIPLNSMEFGCVAKFHGTFKNSMEFHGTFVVGLAIPWNSIEFHIVWCWHQVPWNFQSSMEFHGTSFLTVNNSMEFHGIPMNCEILILINFIIGEVYFTVCCVISCYYVSDNPLVVAILRYFNSKSTFLVSLILLKWWYSILNGGLLSIFRNQIMQPLITL